jgi:hypothetical protein
MGMVAQSRRIGSAYVVVCHQFGSVSRFAREHGISRQAVYDEAKRVTATLEGTQTRQKIEALQAKVAAQERQIAELQARLDVAVVIDDEKQAEFSGVGQACGVTLPQCHTLLEVLIPGKSLSVASLGRRTQALGEKAGALLTVCDEFAREKVRDAAADEIYVRDPVLMVVEQQSLCWLSGRLSAEATGAVWSKELGLLPNLEQVARDGGLGLQKGVADLNAQRQEQGREPVLDQGDHFHATRQGGVGLRRAEKQAAKALAEAEKAQKALDECNRQGQSRCGPAKHAGHAWRKAEQAMDTWSARERVWQQSKDALTLITPEGDVNTRAKAEAVLTQTLPHLPDSDFAKSKRLMQRPEMLNYLDRVETRLQALPFPQEIKEAAVRQEALRRRPELLQVENSQAAALRGVLLMCGVILTKAEQVGEQALEAVREIFRRAFRASSLVECINSVLRMHQAQHRKMTQGLLDLKRLYWNCHTFRTGRRRGKTPYQLLGIIWPEGLRWWDVLKITPEQLREKLSTAKKPA